MQQDTVTVLMVVLAAREEMVVTQVKAVMVEMEETFESPFPKPTLISLCSMVQPRILAEKGVYQGIAGSQASLFSVILPRLSKINFSLGSGGMGGAAGSPYRYLEYDDKQNRVLKTIRGGECGRPGNNGLHGVRALPGQDGRNGKFRIEVTDGH